MSQSMPRIESVRQIEHAQQRRDHDQRHRGRRDEAEELDERAEPCHGRRGWESPPRRGEGRLAKDGERRRGIIEQRERLHGRSGALPGLDP